MVVTITSRSTKAGNRSRHLKQVEQKLHCLILEVPSNHCIFHQLQILPASIIIVAWHPFFSATRIFFGTVLKLAFRRN